MAPAEVVWDAPADQSPVSPVFDELTRQRTKEIIARYPQSRSALLPLLHLVQSVEGFVSQDGIRYCAEALGLTTAEVSAVATFYTMYKRTPCGEHLVSVCTNTLCAALGGDEIYERLQRPARHRARGDGRRARQPGLDHPGARRVPGRLRPGARCCRSTTSTSTTRRRSPRCELVDALRRGERPQPTRGAPLTDLRTVALELAGIFDDLERTVEGLSVADETLRGARLATERGWTAPAMPDQPPAFPDLPEKS